MWRSTRTPPNPVDDPLGQASTCLGGKVYQLGRVVVRLNTNRADIYQARFHGLVFNNLGNPCYTPTSVQDLAKVQQTAVHASIQRVDVSTSDDVYGARLSAGC